MTAFVVDRAPVTGGLLDLLRTFLLGQGSGGSDLRVEVGQAPSNLATDAQGLLTDPYTIIYPLNSTQIMGDLAHPEGQVRLSYQLTSVGRTAASAQLQSDRIRRGITERVGSGDFARAILAGAATTVVGRFVQEVGIVVPVAGQWNAHDLINLEVHAHA